MPGGNAVLSISRLAPRAARSSPIPSTSQSRRSRSVAPWSTALRACETSSTKTDTAKSTPGKEDNAVMSEISERVERAKYAPDRANASRIASLEPSATTVSRHPGTPRSARLSASLGLTTHASGSTSVTLSDATRTPALWAADSSTLVGASISTAVVPSRRLLVAVGSASFSAGRTLRNVIVILLLMSRG